MHIQEVATVHFVDAIGRFLPLSYRLLGTSHLTGMLIYDRWIHVRLAFLVTETHALYNGNKRTIFIGNSL